MESKNPTMRKNHGARSSEVLNPIRRSFSGKPFGKPSGGFNPAIPANRPSGLGLPGSSIDEISEPIGRELDGKENGADRFVKQWRVESPGPMKPTKHFMSPTISTVSKINASPRKKILTERNELTRSSWSSLSSTEEGPTLRWEAEGSECCEPAVAYSSSSRSRSSSMKKVAFDSEVQVIPATNSDPISGQGEVEVSYCFNSHEVDAKDKSGRSPSVKSPHSPLAPLDADPLMTPYDPDINFLLPRPQFLHYRPTPTIKRFLVEKTDNRYVNESIDFVEGLSEAELTEETSSDDSTRGSQSDVLGGVDVGLKDDEEVDFTENDEKIDVDGYIGIEEAADAGYIVTSEESELTSVAGNDLDDLDMTITDEMEVAADGLGLGSVKENDTVEAKQAAKMSLLFTGSKLSVLILAVLLAGMAMAGIHSQITSSGVTIGKDWGLYKMIQEAGIGEYAKVNVDEISRNLGQLRDNSLDYIFGLIRELRGERGIGRTNYHNSSSMQDDSVFKKDMGTCFLLNNQNHGWNDVESWMEDGAEAATVEEQDDNDSSNGAGREAEKKRVDDGIMGFSEDAGSDEVLLWEEETKLEETAVEREFEEKVEVEFGNELIEESSGIRVNVEGGFEIGLGDEWAEDDKPAAAESRIESFHSAVEFKVESNLEVEKDDLALGYESTLEGEKNYLALGYENTLKVEKDYLALGYESSFEVEKDDLTPRNLRKELSAVFTVGGISALILTLATFAGVIFFKTKRATVATPNSKEQQPWKLRKFDIIPPSATNTEEHHNQLWQKKHASSSCPTVVDMAGESCPSEMSSYQENSVKSEGRVRANAEVQSRDKRHKNNNIHRRESLASSSDFSTGTPSYGSFTTYEEIPLKHRNGEEEVIVTPIRRSSRLLKRVVSP